MARIRREVEAVEVPVPVESPWFTVHIGADLSINLAWCFCAGAALALLTVGSPDLLDALIAYLGRL